MKTNFKKLVVMLGIVLGFTLSAGAIIMGWGYIAESEMHSFQENCSAIPNAYVKTDGKEYVVDGVLSYCTDCDHFEFADGQHRVCVTAKLSRKGFNVRLNTVLKVNEGTKCRWCLMQEKYDREYKKFNLFQKLFKTKKYMKYIKDKDDFYFREFITKL